MPSPLLEFDSLKRRMSSLCLAFPSSLSRKSRHLYSPLEKNQIRLLKLHPGEFESQIQCSLRSVDLLAYEDIAAESSIEGWERFDTISYVWGDHRRKVEIVCDGSTVHVTINLADALRRFRDPQQARVLWADALCINQRDNDERAAQVRLMGLIYFKARRVRIWLGRDDEVQNLHRAHHVLELVQRYDRLYQSCDPDPGGKKIQVLSERLFSDPTSTQDPGWIALSRLLKRPWFTRVWVVQELGLSRDATFYCGEVQINRLELDRFGRVLLYSKTGLEVLRKLDMQMINLGRDYWRSAWGNGRIELGQDPREAETFFDILRSVRGLSCTDPRDMIYAFLGHPSAFKRHLLDVDPYYWYPTNYYDNRPTIISPNYDESNTFPGMCVDLAVTAIRDYNIGLNVLSHVAHNDETIKMDFLSWIPRWDLMDTPSQFHGSQIYYEASRGLSNTTFLLSKSASSASSTKLSIKALHLGKVWYTYRAPTSGPPERLANTLAQLLGDIPRRGQVSHIEPPDSISYPYSDAFLLALGMTLTAGLTTGHDFDIQPADEHASHHLNIFKAYYEQQEDISSGSLSCAEDADFFAEDFIQVATQRSVILTLEGHFGLGPAISDWGDEVWLPMGARMPFIFRPTGDGGYKVVGQTFIHGLMRGEAVEGMSEANFETVVLS